MDGGFLCKADREPDKPVKDHARLVKVWETPDVFKVPESVLYDRKRNILYVSSFDRLVRRTEPTGFLSKVRLDGEVEELKWVTGLDGPCGMGIHGDRLYVVEGVRCSLMEIDIESGTILNRYPMPNCSFLNDLAIDKTGAIYLSNTSRVPKASDIFKCVEGECEVWMKGDQLHRSNGLFIHGDELIVGNTGDGSLKAVSLNDKRVRSIICLGAGVIDGIRVANDGSFLVSHWEGETYLISPDGDVVEVGDTGSAGLNAADFEFIKEKNLLIVPTFLGNRVTAYRLVSGREGD